jgi:hypothetical protein
VHIIEQDSHTYIHTYIHTHTQGHIIEQDFDVKPGKQFKTPVHASGKLMLQLEFTSANGAAPPAPAAETQARPSDQQSSSLSSSRTNTDAMPHALQGDAVPLPNGVPANISLAATSSSSLNASGAPSAPVEAETFVMNITVIEARDVRRIDGKDCAEAYACVSLVRDPQTIQQHHFLLLDHYIGGSGGGPEFMMLPPQHSTRIISGGLADPKWGDGCSLRDTHPGVAAIESMHREARLSASTQRFPLSGEPTLMLLTVHDHSAGDAGFGGRVLIPQISRMQPVDQWFMLQVGVRVVCPCMCSCRWFSQGRCENVVICVRG